MTSFSKTYLQRQRSQERRMRENCTSSLTRCSARQESHGAGFIRSTTRDTATEGCIYTLRSCSWKTPSSSISARGSDNKQTFWDLAQRDHLLIHSIAERSDNTPRLAKQAQELDEIEAKLAKQAQERSSWRR